MILFGEGSGSREDWLEAMSVDNSIEGPPTEEQQRFNDRAKLGSAEFYNMMKHFYETDSDYERKEAFVWSRVQEGFFASCRPEDWGQLVENLYRSVISTERLERGARAVDRVMERFHETDSSFESKGEFVEGCIQRGTFAGHPPEQWAKLAKMLYLMPTAILN